MAVDEVEEEEKKSYVPNVKKRQREEGQLYEAKEEGEKREKAAINVEQNRGDTVAGWVIDRAASPSSFSSSSGRGENNITPRHLAMEYKDFPKDLHSYFS